VRVDALLSSVTVGTLERLAQRRGTSIAAVVARAISHEKFVDDVQSAGGKVMIVDRRGGTRVLVPR